MFVLSTVLVFLSGIGLWISGHKTWSVVCLLVAFLMVAGAAL
jgi:hypothetical protein